MAVDYPADLPLPLATKTAAKVPTFGMAQPRRGTPYTEPRATDSPTIYEVEWLLEAHQAAAFRNWVFVTLQGGSGDFRIPLRTEDGLQVIEGRFAPDGLLDRQRLGTLWRYTATIVSGVYVVTPTLIVSSGGPAVGVASGLQASIAASDGALSVSVGVGTAAATGLAAAIALPTSTSSILRTGTVAPANNGFNSSNASFAWPAGSNVGDLGILVVFSQPGRTISIGTTGMVLVDEFIASVSSLGAVCRVFAKIKESGDFSMGVTINGGNGIIAGQMVSYRNFATVYTETIQGISNAAASTSLAFPSAASAVSGAEVLLIAIRTEAGSPWFTIGATGNLAGVTEIGDSSWSSGGIRASFAVLNASLPAAGSIGAVTGTSTGSNTYSTRVLIFK